MIDSRRWCLRAGLTLSVVCMGLLLFSTDRRVLLLARNTLWLSLGACLVSLPLGTALGFLLARTDIPLRRTAWLLLTALLLLPLYLQAAAWDAGFGRLGWYSAGGNSPDVPLLSGWFAAIWVHGLWSVAWVTLIVAVALSASEPELEEAALLDAPPWRVFCWVTLQRALPGVVAAGLWVALMTAGEMTVTDLYQIRTLAEELYTGFAMSAGDEATFGFAAAALFTGMSAGIAVVVLDVLVAAAEHVPSREPFCFRLGRWRWPGAGLVTMTLVLLAGVPLANLIYQAGTVVEQLVGKPVQYWSIGRCIELLIPLPGTYRASAVWQFADPFRWTLVISTCAATLSVTLAVLLGWWARHGSWRAVPAVVVTSLGLSTMGPLVGLALIWVFTLSDHSLLVWGYDRTIVAPVLAATIRALPLPVIICLVAFGTLNRDIMDAATLDGAGPVSRLTRIGVPQRRCVLTVAWLVAFAASCGELSATILVTPPGMTTIPIRVFGLLHAGVGNQVAAVCLTSMGGYLVLATLVIALRPTRWPGSSFRVPNETSKNSGS